MAQRNHWLGVSLHRRKHGYTISYDHPSEVIEKVKKLKSGETRTYTVAKRVERTLRADDGSPVVRRDVAERLAEAFYGKLVEARMEAQANGPLVETEPSGEELVRWPIAGCLADWLARPGVKEATAVTNGFEIRPFKSMCEEAGLVYLDELTFQHGEQLRKRLADSGRAPSTLKGQLHAAVSFLEWCRGKLRLTHNPFKVGKLEGFGRRRKAEPLRYLPPETRQRIFESATTTQERLIIGLTMLVGLRNSEACHLRWGHYIRNVEPPELDIAHSAPNEDDPKGWDPKTGERVARIFWPEVRALLDRWFNETPYGRGKGDPILVDPATGKAYRTLPKRLMERIQREVEQKWTYQVGRRIACSLAVIHAPRLTGHPWGQHDHEAHFGHSTATANGYYFDKKLPRNRRLEEGASEQPDHTASAGLSESEGLSVALAKQLLARLCELTSTSRNALATQLGISETAIRKWQANGKSVPAWFWTAMRHLSK